MSSKIKIVIVDDNPTIIKTLIKSFSLFEEIEVIYTATNGVDLLQKMEYHNHPDIIIMDLDMPVMNGISTIFEVRKKFPDKIKIIVLTVLDTDEKIFDAILAGANGYLLKDEKVEKILSAIHEVLGGGACMSPGIAYKMLSILRNNISTIAKNDSVSLEENMTKIYHLTDREIQIVKQIAEGCSYKKVAELLFISDRTVNKHLENIYKKLNIKSKLDILKIVQKYTA
jgi:DNA-binding NarL/FixJ family response regulator